MYSTEQRRLAIGTFIRFGHSCADTIAKLGYPTRTCLRNWWRECGETGEVPVGKMIREPRLSDGQKREAAEHCLSHGKSLSRTMRSLGYPKGSHTLRGWIDELASGQRKYRGPNPKRDPVPVERKVQVIAALEARTGPAAHGALHMAKGDQWEMMPGTPKRKAFPCARNTMTCQTTSRCCRTCCARRRCSPGRCSPSPACARRPSK